MKVTFVTYIYPYPERGFNPGIERVVEGFSKELVCQGHNVHVVTTYRNGGQCKNESHEGVNIHRIPDTRRYLGRTGSLFAIDLLSQNFTINEYSKLLESSDIIHTFTPIIRKRFSTPLVAHFHHWDHPKSMEEYLFLPISNRMWLKCYKNCDRIISVSENSAEELYLKGVRRNKVDIVYNGVDTDIFNTGPIENNLGNGNELLFVGPLSERKGLKYLIRALPTIKNKHQNTHLTIVGGGSQEKLKKEALSQGVLHAVEFEGFVSEDALPNYYASADIFVMPSLKEGFGIVLLEAMASGLPVVGTNIPPIKEVVNGAGFLCDKESPKAISQSVCRLIESPDEYKKCQEMGIDRVKNKFSMEKVTKRLLETYSTTIRNHD